MIKLQKNFWTSHNTGQTELEQKFWHHWNYKNMMVEAASYFSLAWFCKANHTQLDWKHKLSI